MGRIGSGLAEFSSSIRLFETAFWVAWICIVYSGDCIVVPLGDPYSTTSTAFMVSTLSVGLTLFTAGLFPALAERLLANARFLVAAGLLAGLSTIGTAFAGAIPLFLFFLSAVAGGVFTSVLALVGGVLYSEVDTKKSILAACFALIVGVLVYALASLCAVYYSPLVVAIITALLPIMGILLALVPVDAEAPLVDEAAHKLSPSFWRVLAFCGILLFALSAVRGYFPQLMDANSFAASRASTALGLIAAALFVAALAARLPRTGSFSAFFYWLMVGTVVAILPIALLGMASPLSGALGGVANGVVCMATWCLLADLSHRTGMSPARVMGFGYSAVAFAMTLGFALGNFFGEIIATQYDYLSSVVFLIACIAIAVALVQRKALDELLTPTQAVLETVVQSEHGAGAPEAEARIQREGADDGMAAQGGAATDARPGKFIQRCNLIAEEHGLSARETEVFILLAKHMEAKAIADELFISFNTARTHIQKVYGKLDVHSRRELLELVDTYRT